MRRNSSGFTLVELILTMAIIAILSVIGIGSYTQATIKSRDTQRKNDLNQITKALELYNNDVVGYPTVNIDGEMMCIGIDGSLAECGTSIYAYFDGEKAIYMSSLPSDPNATRDYIYVPDDPIVGSYSLYTSLENVEDRDVVVDSEGEKTDWEINCGDALCNYKLTETGLIRTK